MNDPRGILEEFVRACDGFRDRREAQWDGAGALFDPETQRRAYRAKHEAEGICRSCTMRVNAGRKYCAGHLALANERARRSLSRRRAA